MNNGGNWNNQQNWNPQMRNQPMQNGWQPNNMCGVFTPETQFNFDVGTLVRLGFNQQSIAVLQQIVAAEGKVSIKQLCNMGIDYVTAKDMKYMYDIAVGRIRIESEADLIRHLRKTFGRVRRIGIQDLSISSVREVPRVAVVAGIKEEPYTIYNSANYDLRGAFYRVTSVSRTRIEVETRRRPKLKVGYKRVIENVLEIKQVKKDGNVVISFSKNVCRLCNRFIVVASLRRPEFHLGMVEIICIEGTKVYVFAQILGPTEAIRYNNGTQRVYSYGYFKSDINRQVLKVASQLYRKLCGISAKTHAGNQDFNFLPDDVINSVEDVFD